MTDMPPVFTGDNKVGRSMFILPLAFAGPIVVIYKEQKDIWKMDMEAKRAAEPGTDDIRD